MAEERTTGWQARLKEVIRPTTRARGVEDGSESDQQGQAEAPPGVQVQRMTRAGGEQSG
jgi:hypothetical protein